VRSAKLSVVTLGIAIATAGVIASPACRAPTQAMITVSTTVECGELSEVALIVSGEPSESEDRTKRGFYSAQTTHCDGSKTIGSLVVTPGGERAAVIVLTGPKGKPLSECRPPGYAGCIVARRAFAFIDNVTLNIPVSLDADCRGISCDAFTTCRRGRCFSSQVTCAEGGDCRLDAELPDGGLKEDAEVTVDGSLPKDGSSDDASSDGASSDGAAGDGGQDGEADAGDDSGFIITPPPGVMCGGGMMTCNGAACDGLRACCENAMVADSLTCVTDPATPICNGPTKGRRRYCCSSANCTFFPDTPNCSTNGQPGVCTP
jgi:hypothetical protein